MTYRTPNTSSSGGAFSAAVVDTVWQKGQIVAGYDSRIYRKDACGAWMERASYGKTTGYGWEIDHIRPVAQGGTDDMSNLQPLLWQNNRHKADSFPHWSCAIRAA